jgi:hypothetical protein
MVGNGEDTMEMITTYNFSLALKVGVGEID